MDKSDKTITTREQADRMAELLSKLMKLQRLMRIATSDQRDRIWSKADDVIRCLVTEFDADKTWCEALVTFGGQYYADATKFWLGGAMSDDTMLDCLRREVYAQNRLDFKHEPEPEDYEFLFEDEKGEL